ncbi:MAG: hypothetical protein GYB67_14145 [Chloroflexi bacterium]|nr:hypothetical protein [Chloroflexota bacterium]
MDDFTTALVSIISAESVSTTAAAALHTLIGLIKPRWACLLVWDRELARYIIGGTWLDSHETVPPATLRRRVLKLGMHAQADDPHTARVVEDVFYQPLTARDTHVGAFCIPCQPEINRAYELLMQTTAQTLYTSTRLEQADQEHAQLEADRERLEHLLQAVEQQQRTIDRLLATERQFSAALEAKVEERTAALRAAQASLIQSEKLAVIGQLASSLAHELNNPLQAIQSGLGLVMDEIGDDQPPAVREDLRIIQAELERIQGIFRQMLDFYRPSTYQYAPLDANAICTSLRVLLRKRLQEANVTLQLQLAAHLPLTCGDGNQIQQVILNLLLNAADAMTAMGGQIVLRTDSQDQHVCISVSDDGRGIPEAHLAHLFEPLFTTKTRGLGLGLAISQEIIQRHGGAITVESQLNQGTTFTVRLPTRATCDEQNENPRS